MNMSRARRVGPVALIFSLGLTTSLLAASGSMKPAGWETSVFPSTDVPAGGIHDIRAATTPRTAWAGGGAGGQGGPTIALEYTTLNFGARVGGLPRTAAQTVGVNLESGSWTATSITSGCGFVTVTDGAGTGTGLFTVSLGGGLSSTGTFLCQIEVAAPGASNSPQYIAVNVVVYAATSGPFGSFDTPADGVTGLAGSLVVGGWALDDIEVSKVELYRDSVPGDPGYPGQVFIGDADFVEGARPDVMAAFPNRPLNYRAGWGYLLLTNFLPNQGNGTFRLYAYATDKEGRVTSFGSRQITVDNASAIYPFGAIDTPTQGGTASGASYVNFGWALASLQSIIPTDGSTIWVFIDGAPQGHPVYNNYRVDIATLFPGYANAGTVGDPMGGGAVGYFFIDTTMMTNGVHTIAWSVTDAAARTAGVGSRYFTVFNGSASAIGSPSFPASPQLWRPVGELARSRDAAPLGVRTGFDLEARFEPIEAGGRVEISDLGRLEVDLGTGPVDVFLVRNGRLARLPGGATLDAARGRFHWQPAPAFLGEYQLAFVRQGRHGPELTSLSVVVTPQPSQSEGSDLRLARDDGAR
jgi:hypothetical protein